MRPRGVIGWTQALALAATVFFVADLIYLAFIWPDFDALDRGVIPKSSFIRAYESRRREDKTLPALRWRPLRCEAIPERIGRVFTLAEDSRFFQHYGVDWEAVQDAFENNWRRGKLAVGASSISQQTTKNLFLSPARTPLRKWHELLLTYGMELRLDKERILCLYLNIAELGPGVFGIGAAAQQYFGVSPADLDLGQIIDLAATLPSPRLHNPATRSRAFNQRRERIRGHVRAFL